MREYPDPLKPGGRLPYFERWEIEDEVQKAMRETGFDPAEPQAFSAEIFLQERYGLGVILLDLPEGVWGEAKFSPDGLSAVTLNRGLLEMGRQGELLSESTLAHEAAGHGMFHLPYIVPELRETMTANRRRGLRGASAEKALYRLRCGSGEISENPGANPVDRFGQRRALEWQANFAMGCFKLPAPAVRNFLGLRDDEEILERLRRDGSASVVQKLMDTFDVSRAMATFRLMEIFPRLKEAADSGNDRSGPSPGRRGLAA